MFESILETILTKYFGEFLEGLDKNNLKIGIWSGHIILQNVSLKTDFIKKLQLPLDISYSFVGKLCINIPWNALGSQPVMASLENVNLIIKSIKMEEWINFDYDSVWKKLTNLQGFVNEALKKLTSQQKTNPADENTQSQGMVGKMTKRVLDNLQVTIRNIHLRFENYALENPFAIGITLNQISIYTANENWIEEFIDRTNPKFKLEPLRKIISIKEFKIYWDVTNLNQDNQFTMSNTKLLMENINNSKSFTQTIIEISSDTKLSLKNPANPLTLFNPDTEVSTQLEPIHLKLLKNELELIIKTLEYFNNCQRYRLQKQVEAANKINSISANDKRKYQENFETLFKRIQLSDYKTNFNTEEILNKIFNNHAFDLVNFMEAIKNLPESDLNNTARDIITSIFKEKNFKKTSSRKFGFLSDYFNKGKESENKDLEKLQAMLDDAFNDNEAESKLKASINPQNFDYIPKLSLDLIIKGGSFCLANTTKNNTEEGISFYYEDIKIKVEQCAVGNMISVQLKNYGIHMEAKPNKSTDITYTPLLQRMYDFNENDQMISIILETNPKSKEEGIYVNITMLPFEIIYRAMIIERFLDLTTLKCEDEKLKSSAQLVITNAKKGAKNSVGNAVTKPVKKFVTIFIGAPNIIIPFGYNSGNTSECWVAALGNLKINSIHDANDTNTVYEEYGIVMDKIHFQYYSSQQSYEELKILSISTKLSLPNSTNQDKNTLVYDIISDIQINANIKIKQPAYTEDPNYETQPNLDLHIGIPTISLKIKPYIYKNLLNIKEQLAYKAPDSSEKLETRRVELIYGSDKNSMLYYKEYSWSVPGGSWIKYYAIFKGAYIHFFSKENDNNAKFSFFIKCSDVYTIHDENNKYCFILENTYNKGTFGCDEESEMNDWIKILSNRIAEYDSLAPIQLDSETNDQIKIKPLENEHVNYIALKNKITFVANTISISIDANNNGQKLIECQAKVFGIEINQKACFMNCNVSIVSLEAIDYGFTYTNPKLMKLFTSIPFEKKSIEQGVKKSKKMPYFIKIIIEITNPTHPSYTEKKTDMSVQVVLGYCFLNLKPDFIKKLFEFFNSNTNTNPQHKIVRGSSKNIDNNSKNNSLENRNSIGNSELNKELTTSSQVQSVDENPLDQSRILMSINVHMTKAIINFIHQENHFLVSKIPLKNMNITMIKKSYEMQIKITMTQLKITDMTNYPFTLNSNTEWEKVQSFDIISAISKDITNNAVEIEMNKFDPKSGLGDPNNKIFTFIKVTFNKMKICFFNQPLLRLIDYLNYQIMPLLFATPPALTKKSDALTNLNAAMFNQIQVFLNEPSIALKTIPNTKDYIDICLGAIQVSNKIQNSHTRILLSNISDNVFSEEYTVQMKNMEFWRIKNDKKYQMSRNIQMQIKADRPLFLNEYTVLYGQNSINTGQIIKINISPLVMAMYHEDYLQWMKTLNYNVWYDDLLDSICYIDYEQRRKLKPAPLSTDVNIDQISLLCFKDDAPFEIPQLSFNLIRFNVKMNRDNGESIMKLSSKKLHASYFQIDSDKQVLIERTMLGKLDVMKIYPQSSLSSSSKTLDDIISHYQAMPFGENNQKDDNLFIIMSNNSTQKSMQICLNNINIYLQTFNFMSLLKFVTSDLSIYPPPAKPSIDVVVIKQEFKITYGKCINLKNLTVVLPSGEEQSNFENNLIALSGDFAIVKNDYPELTLEELKNLNQAKINEIPLDQANPQNIVSEMNLSLQNLEFFASNLKALSETSLLHLKKRNLISPFDLILSRRTHSTLKKNDTEILNVTCNDLLIQKFKLSISYEDYLLLQNSLTFQKTQSAPPAGDKSQNTDIAIKSNNSNEENIKTSNSDKNAEAVTTQADKDDTKSISKNLSEDTEKVTNDQKNTELTKSNQANENSQPQVEVEGEEDYTEKFNILFCNLEMILMDNSSKTLTPVLEFCFNQVDIHLLRCITKLNMNISIIFCSTFYNGLICAWEPFIEKYGLKIDLTKQTKSPNMEFSLCTQPGYEDLNINMSDNMIEILSSMKRHLAKDSAKNNEKNSETFVAGLKIKDYIQENIYATPITVCNMIGYDIQVQQDPSEIDISNTFSSGNNNNNNNNKPKYEAPKIVDIKNNDANYYLIPNETNEIIDQGKIDFWQTSQKIRLSMDHPRLNFEPVNGIILDKIAITSYIMKCSNVSFKMFCDLRIQDAKRVLVISTQSIITNSTNHNIRVQLECELLTSIEFDLEPHCSKGIPFEFTYGKIAIKLLNMSSEYSEKKNLKNIFEIANATADGEINQDIEKINEFKCGSYYLMVNCIKKDPELDFYELVVEVPFEIKNCCALPILYNMIGTKINKIQTITLKTQQSHQEIFYSMNDLVTLQVKSRNFDWSNEVPVALLKKNEELGINFEESEEEPGTLALYDVLGLKLLINIHEKISPSGAKIIYLYTKACLINETPWSLYYYSMDKDDKSSLVPGQIKVPNKEDDSRGLNDASSNIILLNEMHALKLSMNFHSNDMSNEIILGKIGTTYIEVCEKDQKGQIETIKDMSINLGVQQCEKTQFLYTKIITLSPKYILINKTKDILAVKKNHCEKGDIELEPEKRIPLIWNDLDTNTQTKQNSDDDNDHNKHEITMKPMIITNESDSNPEANWEWSGGFDITNPGSYYILISNVTRTKFKYFKVAINHEYHMVFIIFEEQPVEKVSLKVRNQCKDLNLKVYQSFAGPKTGFIIPPGHTIPFAWSYPLEAAELSIDFYLEGVFYYHSSTQRYKFDSLNSVSTLSISVDRQIKTINSDVILEDNSRIMVFYDNVEQLTIAQRQSDNLNKNSLIENKPKEISSLKAFININGIGFSFVSTLQGKKHKSRRTEIMFMIIKSLYIHIIHSNLQKILQFRIKYFNIDNNINFSSTYPVLMTPCKPKSLLDKKKNKHFFDLAIHEKPNEHDTFITYKSIIIHMDPLNIHIDGYVIDALLEISKKISIMTQIDLETSDNLPIEQMVFVKNPRAYQLVEISYFDSRVEWKNLPMHIPIENTYIEELIIHPIDIQLTFELGLSSGSDSNFFFLDFLRNTLGSTLANIDNAPINLTGVKLINVYDSSSGIKGKILKKYREESLGVVCTLLGSVDIIGNPLGLFENIATGMNDLYEKPIEGFLHGPTDGFIGLGEGARSLVQNVLSGTCNSVGKIAGAISNGISAIPLDDDYIEERNIHRMDKPKDAVDGFAKAGKSLWYSVEDGLTGLFVKPYQRAKRDGFKGFLKGTYIGITGVICKPATGVLDAATKTAEGLKTSISYRDEMPNENRWRWPRAFYGKNKKFGPYNFCEAELYYNISTWDDGKYHDNSLMYACDIYPDLKKKDKLLIFGLYLEAICLWNITNNQLVWWIDLDLIEEFKLNKQSKAGRIDIILKNTPELTENKTLDKLIIIENANKKFNNTLVFMVNEAIKNMKIEKDNKNKQTNELMNQPC